MKFKLTSAKSFYDGEQAALMRSLGFVIEDGTLIDGMKSDVEPEIEIGSLEELLALRAKVEEPLILYADEICIYDGCVEFVPHGCTECVYRIMAFPEEPTGERAFEGGTIYITQLSSHTHRWASLWRNRVTRAWAVLRGRADWSGELGFDTVDDLDKVITALQELRPTVWPRDVEP